MGGSISARSAAAEAEMPGRFTSFTSAQCPTANNAKTSETADSLVTVAGADDATSHDVRQTAGYSPVFQYSSSGRVSVDSGFVGSPAQNSFMIVSPVEKITRCIPAAGNVALVMDINYEKFRLGSAADDRPRVVFAPIVNKPRLKSVLNLDIDADHIVSYGEDAIRNPVNKSIRAVDDAGFVSNWDAMEAICKHGFQQLGVDAQDHPILVTEPTGNPRKSREQMIEMLFNTFHLPATYLANQTCLYLYQASGGRRTGVVVDCGEVETEISAVYEGSVVPYSIQRLGLGASHVTNFMMHRLNERGARLMAEDGIATARNIRDNKCRVALNYEQEIAPAAAAEIPVDLPDGTVIGLGRERLECPEALFQPSFIGQTSTPGIHDAVYNCINSICGDGGFREELLGNIALRGDICRLPGFAARLESELTSRFPPGNPVRVIRRLDLEESVWCGGSQLATLPQFTEMCVSRDEYQLIGAEFLHVKCF